MPVMRFPADGPPGGADESDDEATPRKPLMPGPGKIVRWLLPYAMLAAGVAVYRHMEDGKAEQRTMRKMEALAMACAEYAKQQEMIGEKEGAAARAALRADSGNEQMKLLAAMGGGEPGLDGWGVMMKVDRTDDGTITVISRGPDGVDDGGKKDDLVFTGGGRR